jgi:hypothetical protein
MAWVEVHLRRRWRHRPIRHILRRKLRDHRCIIAEILAVGTSEVGVYFFATGGRRWSGGGSFASLLLPVFLTIFRRDLPLHAFARLICPARDLLEGFVERKIVSDGVLQDCQDYFINLEGGFLTCQPLFE